MIENHITGKISVIMRKKYLFILQTNMNCLICFKSAKNNSKLVAKDKVATK